VLLFSKKKAREKKKTLRFRFGAPLGIALVLSLFVLVYPAPLQAQLQITATVPSRGLSSASHSSPIELTFDRSLDTTSISPVSIRIIGEYQGQYGFTYEYVDSLNLLKLRPQPVFIVGEFVTITFAAPGLRGRDGSTFSRPSQH
jgi:hypothetical protein